MIPLSNNRVGIVLTSSIGQNGALVQLAEVTGNATDALVIGAPSLWTGKASCLAATAWDSTSFLGTSPQCSTLP